MAKVLFGPAVANASGTIGGIVFSHNTAGPYIRRKGAPVNPATTLQGQRRTAFGQLSTYWRSLSANARASWRSEAQFHPMTDPLGQTVYPTGFALFMQNNINRLLFGAAIAPECPLLQPIWNPGTLTLLADQSPTPLITLAFTGTPSTLDRLMVWATPGMSAGIKFPKPSTFRLIDLSTMPTSPLDLYPAWRVQFGDLVSSDIGKKIFIRAAPACEQYWVSPGQIVSTTVTA
jgi:hypothetical protein